MTKRTNLIAPSICLFLLVSLVGCGASGGQAESVPQDELTAYLDDHPELKETPEFDMEAELRSATGTE